MFSECFLSYFNFFWVLLLYFESFWINRIVLEDLLYSVLETLKNIIAKHFLATSWSKYQLNIHFKSLIAINKLLISVFQRSSKIFLPTSVNLEPFVNEWDRNCKFLSLKMNFSQVWREDKHTSFVVEKQIIFWHFYFHFSLVPRQRLNVEISRWREKEREKKTRGAY